MPHLSKRFNIEKNKSNHKKIDTRKIEMQKGQALLVFLLALSVAIAVVLSSVSSSVTEVGVSTVSEESTRAFSAAEAGAERALILESRGESANIQDADFDTNTSTSYDVDAAYQSPTGNQFVYPIPLSSGEGATFWLSNRDTSTGEFSCGGSDCFNGNSFRVCWGNKVDSDPNPPAAVISVYYDSAHPQAISSQDFSGVEVARVAYDENNISRNNRFSDPNSGGCTVSSGSSSKEFEYRANVRVGGGGLDLPCAGSSGCILMVRTRLLYDETDVNPVGIIANTGSGSLPPQGISIKSTGESGEAVRKVQVFRTFPELPIPFESSVFSASDIVK